LAKVLLQSYIGGCFFGVIMLAFSFMMTANQAYIPVSNIEETKYKYSNMKEFKKSVVDVINFKGF
jgi:formate/nitrite transporter FocA (FNT family)